MHQKVVALGDALPPDCHWKLVATSRCQRSQSMRDFRFSGKLRISWSQMLHYTYKAIRWRTQISLIITARKSKIIDQKEDESHVGWYVWKSYLQYERHSRIGYDNDGQCHAPVMRNTHDLSGGRATGKNTSSNTHTHLHQLSVCQSLPRGSRRWRGQDAAWWRKEKYTDRCRIARTALQKNILDKPDMGGEEEKTINKFNPFINS